jgi:hypothetical protein
LTTPTSGCRRIFPRKSTAAADTWTDRTRRNTRVLTVRSRPEPEPHIAWQRVHFRKAVGPRPNHRRFPTGTESGLCGAKQTDRAAVCPGDGALGGTPDVPSGTMQRSAAVWHAQAALQCKSACATASPPTDAASKHDRSRISINAQCHQSATGDRRKKHPDYL